MSYGYCPECGAEGVTRERRPNGYDKCARGHSYKSNRALKKPSLGSSGIYLRFVCTSCNACGTSESRLGEVDMNYTYNSIKGRLPEGWRMDNLETVYCKGCNGR